MLGKRSPEKSVTEARLVEAAAQLFARNGFKATATREIAQLANLNEATLFRYFPRKPDLFFAALESHLLRIKLGRELQACLIADERPDVVLPKIVDFVVTSLVAHPELQHLLHVATFELPEAQTIIHEYLGPIFALLCGYFERSGQRKVTRPMEPTLAALGLFGAVAANEAFRRLTPQGRSRPLNATEDVAAYADLCLYGLTLQSPSSPVE